MYLTELSQIYLEGDNGPDPSRDFDLCVAFVTLTLFTGFGRLEHLLLCWELSNWGDKEVR